MITTSTIYTFQHSTGRIIVAEVADDNDEVLYAARFPRDQADEVIAALDRGAVPTEDEWWGSYPSHDPRWDVDEEDADDIMSVAVGHRHWSPLAVYS